MTFPLAYEILDIWNATITEHTAGSYTVRNNVWNADIRPGESVSFGLTAECAETVSFPEVFVLNRAGEVPEQSVFSASYVFHSDWGDWLQRGNHFKQHVGRAAGGLGAFI